MADKNEMLAELDRLESDLANTYALVGSIKDALNSALSENTQILLENDKLRARLEELEALEKSGGTYQPSTNMLQVFNDGFHICHAYYGKALAEGENCLLCQELIYR